MFSKSWAEAMGLCVIWMCKAVKLSVTGLELVPSDLHLALFYPSPVVKCDFDKQLDEYNYLNE